VHEVSESETSCYSNADSSHQERDLYLFGHQAPVVAAEAFVEASGEDSLAWGSDEEAVTEVG
jgi:hypothetical protein